MSSVVPPDPRSATALADPWGSRLPLLLRGEHERIGAWLAAVDLSHPIWCVAVIVLGAGLYGGAIGLWRAPLQAGFAAVKLPLILLLTALGNGALNGLLAPLLGARLTLRQTALAVLTSFALAAAILGAFSPLVVFEVWSLPEVALTADLSLASRGSRTLATTSTSLRSFSILQLTNVLAVAFAGIAANVRLRQLLTALTGSTAVASRVLLAWLLGNFLLGTQLTWILRPFFGAPTLPVEFLRPNAWEGNFFESVWANLHHAL